MKKENVIIISISVLIVIVIVAFAFSLLPEKDDVQLAPDDSTVSSVTVGQHIAIQLSPELASGIVFESVEEIPSLEVDALENYGADNSTLYFINVSSNRDVHICVNASGPLSSGSDFIPLSNEFFSYSNFSDLDNPDKDAWIEFSTQKQLASEVIPAGSSIASYYRFWLNIEESVPPGTYSNTLFFVAQPSSAACGNTIGV